jgi:hypothetical protein
LLPVELVVRGSCGDARPPAGVAAETVQAGHRGGNVSRI